MINLVKDDTGNLIRTLDGIPVTGGTSVTLSYLASYDF